MKRGGQPDLEVAHATLLLDSGAEEVWGWSSPAGQERVRMRVRWLTESLGLKSGVTVLECGCGTGAFTRHLAKTGAGLYAADISPLLLAKAREACPDPNVTFIQTDLEHPEELEDESFDVILGVSVLHHLDLPRALPSLYRKLKPGGMFGFSEPNLLNPINRYVLFIDDLEQRRKHGMSPTEMAFCPDELRTAFESAGFVVLTLSHRDFLHPATPRMLIPLVKLGGLIAERLPLMRRWSGSLWITGRK